MKHIIANWKSHKTLTQAKEWMTEFQDLLHIDHKTQNELAENKYSIVVCPPSYLILPLKELLLNLPNYSLGLQNISPFPEGSYTGEIAAHLIKDTVKFTIIGHSERRKYFHENDGDIELRIDSALNNNIQPILCIRSEHDNIPAQAKLIAYEPVEAIGSGKNMPAKEVLELKKKLLLNNDTTFIYGGSVDATNCKEYLETDGIDGLLIGSASLNPQTFFSIVSRS